MLVRQSVSAVHDPSQAGEARRHATRLADEVGLGEATRGKVAIVVSELATNLARYATAGEILLRAVEQPSGKWIEVLSVDRGPGMADVARNLEDGYSTGGTSGNGLGAARRCSTEFDIFSSQPAGTVIYCRLDDKPSPPAERRFTWGVVNRAAPGEHFCGDSWSIAQRPGELAILVADGLGHGPEAAAAAEQGVTAFERDPFMPPAVQLDRAHVAMQGTRGAAVASALLANDSRNLQFAGVGNIAGYLRSDDGLLRRGLMSHNGILGVQVRKIQELQYDCPDRGLLIMHSDGLQSRWSLEDYPGLLRRHPAVIAGVLYRDFTRGRDDVTVAVIRLPETVSPAHNAP